MERKWGGNLHPWLNNGERSIANKYPEGKLKSTSKGELTDLKSLKGKRVHMTLARELVFEPNQQHLSDVEKFSLRRRMRFNTCKLLITACVHDPS